MQRYYPGLTRARVRHILKALHKLEAEHKKKRRVRKKLPVGKHRVQMDIQKLPAVQGGEGFEYKISVIHMRTRIKYSEIHPDRTSETVAAVLVRALDRMPPVRLVWTDNAFEFTMRYAHRSERTTAFQKCLMSLDIIHGTCEPRSPWQNGIIERLTTRNSLMSCVFVILKIVVTSFDFGKCIMRHSDRIKGWTGLRHLRFTSGITRCTQHLEC